MPVTIKKGEIKIKNSSGEYQGVDAIGERSTVEQIAAITAKGNEINAYLSEHYPDVPALEDEVDDLKEETSNLIVNVVSGATVKSGVTITPLGKGVYQFDNTSSGDSVLLITDDIILTAGTYYYGFIPSVPSSVGIKLQIRNYTSGSDGGNVVSEVSNVDSFTLESTIKVRVRLWFGSGKTFSSYIVQPILVKSDVAPEYFIPNTTAVDFVARVGLNAIDKVWDATFLANETDLDDLITPGLYRGNPGNNAYFNLPPSGVDKMFTLEVIGDGSGGAYRIQTLTVYWAGYYKIYGRYYANHAWTEWELKYDMANNKEIIEPTVSDSFSAVSVSSQGENSGDLLRVMSYNICNFNNDTTTYISDETLFNLKKMLYKANADIVCCQEDNTYIDSGSTKNSDNYVYYPVYPYRAGANGVTIHSKKTASHSNIVKYSTGRLLRWATYSIGEKVLLVISTHPGLTTETRAIEYDELFKWAEGDIALENYGTGNQDYAPTHTHCIICGDMNSKYDEDKTNLQTEAASKNYVLGNGGSIGWFITNMHGDWRSIDNIIVSQNVIINSIECYNDWYEKLYSDHVPLVADVTLLNS